MMAKRYREANTRGKNWSWEIKTAVSGMNGELAEILDAAEADGVRNLEENLKEDAFVDANKESRPAERVRRWRQTTDMTEQTRGVRKRWR